MLVVLGFTMILAFMALIMTKKLTPMVALIVVPTIFGLFAGAGLGPAGCADPAVAHPGHGGPHGSGLEREGRLSGHRRRPGRSRGARRLR